VFGWCENRVDRKWIMSVVGRGGGRMGPGIFFSGTTKIQSPPKWRENRREERGLMVFTILLPTVFKLFLLLFPLLLS